MEPPIGKQHFANTMDAPNGLLILSENSDHLFFIYDYTKAKFSYLNPAFKTFFGIDKLTLHPNDLLLTVHPDDNNYLLGKLAGLCAGTNAKQEIECRFIQDRQERSLRISAQFNGTIITGLAEDITLYKENIEILHQHGNKKNSILNILAHDLAGPIGTIRNFCDLIKREYMGPEYDTLQSHLNRIRMISESCTRLIRDFVNQEFLESAGAALLKRRVDLAEKIYEMIREYQSMDLGVNFVSNCDHQIVFVEIDLDKFLQVIQNLISNALKFTPAGGTITINLQQQQHQVILSVADTGIGIPEKYHYTLFDKFTEARRNGLHGEHSTGLGMSIIKTIVEWHGGTISFESEENKGTVFNIALPVNNS